MGEKASPRKGKLSAELTDEVPERSEDAQNTDGNGPLLPQCAAEQCSALQAPFPVRGEGLRGRTWCGFAGAWCGGDAAAPGRRGRRPLRREGPHPPQCAAEQCSALQAHFPVRGEGLRGRTWCGFAGAWRGGDAAAPGRRGRRPLRTSRTPSPTGRTDFCAEDGGQPLRQPPCGRRRPTPPLLGEADKDAAYLQPRNENTTHSPKN